MAGSPTPERVKQVFAEAMQQPVAERAAFVERACAGDAALLAEVKSFLQAMDDAAAAGFFVSPTQAQRPSATDTLKAPSAEGPGTRIGPYKILQLIGEGGFGSVYMAEQSKPVERRVALKIIKLGMDTRQVIARFEAERQALALMDHPNIARVLDAGATEAGRPYFVMELVKGDPITDYCDRNNLSIEERLELFAQVCNAVQHAHQKGIIHRDIKPSNILVSTQDGKPYAKVIDFGIAKATAARLTEKTLFTEHRSLIGTPEYMSPEQAEGSMDIDTRTDVYALGVLLYELLTGATPFDGEKLRSAAYGEMQRIIREVDPPKPSTRLSQSIDTIGNVAAHRRTEPRRLNSIIRGELDWIVMKALEKDRQRRYETANGLAMDIHRYLSGEAVVAAPPSASYRLRKYVARHRGSVAAAAALAILLVIGVAAVVAVQANANRRLSTANAQLTQSFAREANANELQQRRFNLAMEAIHTFHSEISDDVLLKEKEFEALRGKLLGEASRFYGLLQDQGKDAGDDRSREALARAYEGLAEVTAKVGSRDLAIKDYEAARGLLESLTAAQPDNAGLQHRLALVLIELAYLRLDQNESDAPARIAEQTLAICDGLTTKHPDEPEYQVDQVKALMLRANTLADKQGEEHYACVQRSLVVAERLNDAHPNVPEYQSRLAVILNSVGSAEFGRLRFDQAIRYYDRAAALQSACLSVDPANVKIREALVSAEGNKGLALERLGQLEPALAQYRRELAVIEPLATEYPAVVQYQKLLAGTHRNILGALWAMGRNVEAIEAHKQRVAVLTRVAGLHPDRPDLQRDAAVALTDQATAQAVFGRTDESTAAYRQAIEGVRQLVERYPSVRDYQSTLAFILQKLGWSLANTGMNADATDAYNQAIAVFEAMVKADPLESNGRAGLADASRALGYHFGNIGRTEEGLQALARGQELAERLAADFPNDLSHRSLLGYIFGDKGTVLRNAGDDAGSLRAAESARAVWQRLAEEQPNVPRYRSELANVLSLIGLGQKRQGRLDEGRVTLQQCQQQWERLVADNPGQAWYGDNLGRALANQGWADERAGKLDAALALQQRSVQVREGVVAADPKNTNYLRGLGYSLTYLGRVQRRLGQLEASEAGVTRGAKIVEQLLAAHVEVTLVQVLMLENALQLGMLRAAQGNAAEAVKVLEHAVESAGSQQTPSTDELLGLAAVQAQLGRLSSGEAAGTHADRAMQLLASAVAKGYGDASEIGGNDAFDPLHEREDFQRMLAGMAPRPPASQAALTQPATAAAATSAPASSQP